MPLPAHARGSGSLAVGFQDARGGEQALAVEPHPCRGHARADRDGARPVPELLARLRTQREGRYLYCITFL